MSYHRLKFGADKMKDSCPWCTKDSLAVLDNRIITIFMLFCSVYAIGLLSSLANRQLPCYHYEVMLQPYGKLVC